MNFDMEKYEAACKKRQARSKRPKLTLKAAKTIAIQELGTAKGLTPHESNDAEYQRYEMRMGNHTVIIQNECGYWGIAYIYFGGTRTYYDIETLQESYHTTEAERQADRKEIVREMASGNREYMLKVLVEEHGAESCRALLEKLLEK